MKDWNSAIRSAYMALLNTIGGGVKVYYMMAPITASEGNKYIIISSITAVEESDKNSFDGRVSVLLDVVAKGDNEANVTDSESMVAAIKLLINSDTQPDLSPNFACITTEMVSDQQLLTKDSEQTILRRLIRFEHYINQK